MGFLRVFLLLWFLLPLAWGELSLPVPELCAPRLVSQGADVALPHLPWKWLTWNLQWFPGHHPQAPGSQQSLHVRLVAEKIGQIRPQVVILQEVLDPKALETAFPDYPWKALTDFQRAGDEDGKLPPQNVALLSQWPWKEIWEVDFHLMPLTPDRPVRGFLGAEFHDDQGRRVVVYGIHLKSNRGGREASSRRRERAMDALRWDWRRRGLDPARDAILVGGDWNCSVRNPEFNEETIRKLVREGWEVADQELGWPEGATVKADPGGRFPASDFDHFLLSPGYRQTLEGQKLQVQIFSGDEIPSDHYPVEMHFKPNLRGSKDLGNPTSPKQTE